MKSIDYKRLLLSSCSTKELFYKGIFILCNSHVQALPLEYALVKELEAHELNKIVLYGGVRLGRFSIERNLERALYTGLLSEVYLELNKKKGIHTHNSNVCPENCDFQILISNSYFLINKWLVDLCLPFKINLIIKPNFCTNCMTPYESEEEIPEDFLCGKEYRKGYVCRKVYQAEFINKLLPLSESLENSLFNILANENEFKNQFEEFKKKLRFISKRIAKRIYDFKDPIKSLDFNFKNPTLTKVGVDLRFKKEFDRLLEREILDTSTIDEVIQRLKLSRYQARIFKKNLLDKFQPAINIVSKGKCEYFKKIPPKYCQIPKHIITNI